MKTVSDVIAGVPAEKVSGPLSAPVSGLSADSREVQKGFVFFAISGIHLDGHDYIDAVVKNGASLIVHEKELSGYDADTCYLKVQSVRQAMAPVAAAFYDNPSKEMHVIGITGTDGKSSTTYFLTQLFTLAGIKCGCISTVMVKTGDEFEKNPFRQSTPDAPEIQFYLRKMSDNGCSVAVVESTSHGLSPKNARLANVAFDTGILTNISHEHLEFHGTLEQYMDDKANLFRFVKQNNGTAIINYNEKHKQLFSDLSGGKLIRYSALSTPASADASSSTDNPTEKGKIDISASAIKKTGRGYKFDISYTGKTFPAEITISGRFNVDNCLAALAALHNYSGGDFAELVALLPKLLPLKGRMNAVEAGQPYTVIVDYAHSPGSFEKQFPLWREEAEKRLICVFGSAGERDTAKRPLQAAIADKYSDIIILTDEDPRGEDPMAILEEIAGGCPERKRGDNLFLIPDRRKAISKALDLAKAGDYLIFLGKGHENSIIYKNAALPWDEYTIIKEELEKKGYSG